MRAIGSVLGVLFAALLSVSLVPAGASGAPVTQWPQATSDLKANPEVTFGQLPNGLRYAIRHNATPPGEVSMRLVIEAGSMQEAHCQEGVAHLIEHMAFRGSAHVADGVMIKTLQRLGSQPGADLNANTAPDRTVYRFDLNRPDGPSVDTVLGFLREIAGELTFSQTTLESERGVVLAEERDRAGAGLDVHLAQMSAQFPGHPIARSVIGRTEVIEAATPYQLRAFYDAYYRPERAVVVVVGDVDPATIETKIKALFSDWRGRGAAGTLDPAPYAPTGRPTSIVTVSNPGAAQTALSIVWTPPYAPPDWTKNGRIEDLIARIGELALSNRIRRLDEAAGNAFILGGVDSYWIAGVARGEALGARGIGDLPATVRILTTARRQVMTQGLTQAEVDYVVEQLRPVLQRAAAGQRPPIASLSQYMADDLAGGAVQGEISISDQQRFELFEAAVNGLTADTLNKILRGRFTGDGPVVFLVSGARPLADRTGLKTMLTAAESEPLTPYAAAPTTAWSYTAFGEPGQLADRRDVADVDVTMARFANGVRLTVKPLQTAPGQVAVVVRFGHGRLDLPRDRLDSSDWSMILMQIGGLSDLRASDVPRTLTGHSVTMFAAAQDDAFTIGTNPPFGPPTIPAADLDLELQYLAATMTAPGWRSDAWKALVVTTDQDTEANAADPQKVFSTNVRALIQPGDSRWIVDTPKDLAGFTPAAARAFIEPILKNADIEVLVVGDLTADQAIAAVAKTFGALPKRKGTTEPAGSRVEHFPTPAGHPVELRHTGRADKAIAEVSWPTTDEHAAWRDIAPTVVMADILRQRVTERLRTAEGAIYTPNGGAEFSRVFPGWGRVSLLVPCKPQDLSRVYAEIDAIAADLANHPVLDDELQRTLRPDLETAKRQQQQIGYWLGQLAGAQSNTDRLDYIRQTLPRLSAVTAADVQRVAQRWLRADRAFRIEVMPAPAASASVATR
jgi:zinc protease